MIIRVILALTVFIYVGYLAWQQLTLFDFIIVTAFFTMYLLWSLVSQLWIYQDTEEYVIEDDDKKTYFYMFISYVAVLFYAIIDFIEIHFSRIHNFEPAVIYAGFIVFIISSAVRWWGFKSIGKYNNARVAIYENHKLVTTGAYRKIRHPLYLGTFLNLISIALIFNSWGALVLVFLFAFPAILYRIKVEEEFLASKFGDDYKKYIKKSKKMFPGIW